MRNFKDKNVQDKQVDYNSNRLSYLISKIFRFVTNLTGKQHFFYFFVFLMHCNKTDLKLTFLKDKNKKQSFKQHQ